MCRVIALERHAVYSRNAILIRMRLIKLSELYKDNNTLKPLRSDRLEGLFAKQGRVLRIKLFRGYLHVLITRHRKTL